jgi:hypothetical protein
MMLRMGIVFQDPRHFPTLSMPRATDISNGVNHRETERS